MNLRLMNKVKIPKPKHRIGKTMQRGRFSGVEYIKQSTTLFRIKLMMSPIHIPMQKSPALGKQARTYPTKKLLMIVMIIISARFYSGTPGTKTTFCSMASSTMKAVDHPMMTKVARQTQIPKTMNITPMISIAIVYPTEFLEKYVQIVVLHTQGQPILSEEVQGYVITTDVRLPGKVVAGFGLSVDSQVTVSPNDALLESMSSRLFWAKGKQLPAESIMIICPVTMLFCLLHQYQTWWQQLQIRLYLAPFSSLYSMTLTSLCCPLIKQYNPLFYTQPQIDVLKADFAELMRIISIVMSKKHFDTE